MSSSDSDDCYSNVTKKLQNLKNKYHEDQIDTAHLLNVPKSNTSLEQTTVKTQKSLNSEPVVDLDLEDDDTILDQIIALNSTRPRTRSQTREKSSIPRGNKTKNSTTEIKSNQNQRSGLSASAVTLDSHTGRGRGSSGSRNRGARRPRAPLYPCYSIGNTDEYPDQSRNVKLFKKTKPKEANLDDSLTLDDNEELSIKVYWQSSDIIKFTIRKYQKLSQIFEFFSKRDNVSIDKLFLTYNDKKLKPDDTPDSINYNIAKFIDGGIVKNHIPNVENSIEILDGIKLKFQCQNMKKPFEVTIQEEERLQTVFLKCAEHLELPIKKLKFEFDGDTLTGSLTAKELDLEGGECIDVKIIR